MKKCYQKLRRSKVALSSAAVAAIAMAAAKTSAQTQQVFTQWNFDAIGAQSSDNSPAPTTGSGVATALGMTNNYQLSDGSTFSVNSDDVTGSNPLDPTQASGPGTTYAWRVRGNGGGGGNGWSNSAPEYSQGAEFDTSTVGLSGIVFSTDWFSTNQGIHDLQEQYTIDGSDWINFGSVQTNVPNGYVYDMTMDLRGISGVNDDPTFGVRLVAAYDPNHPEFGDNYSGGNGSSIYNNSSGNWRFANVTFSFSSTNTGGGGSSAPVLTWNPPSATWNSSNVNWLDTNNASVSFGGTSTIAAFTDSVLPSHTSTATVTVDAGGMNAAGVNVTNTNGTYTFTGGPIGGGAFVKTGAGNVVLSQGTNANTFNGLKINGGTLHTASDAYLGAATSTVFISGGTLVADAALNLAHSIIIGTNGGAINSNFSLTTSASFALQGAFVKTGSGDTNISVPITSSPGSTFGVMGGNVTFSGTAARTIISTPASGTTFAGNIIIANSKGLTITGGNVAGPGSIFINNNNSEFTGDSVTGTTYTTVNMPIVINSGTSTTWTEAIGASGVGDIMILESAAVISGTSNVIFAGGNSGGKATLIIASQNTYTGNTIINNDSAGLTQLGVDNAFPVATNLSFGDGSNTASIGALDLNGHNQQLGSLATNLPNGSNHIAQFANGLANFSSTPSTVTISGTAATIFNATIGTPTGVILNGGASGNNIALTLAASNTGTLELQGLNTYTGQTTINGGTLQFDAAQDSIGTFTLSSLPVGNNIVNNASLIINSPDAVAGNITGTGITTVTGTSLSYIGTLNSPILTANNLVQGGLVNNGTTTINTLGAISAISGTGALNIGTGSGTAVTTTLSLTQGTVTLMSGALLNLGAPSVYTNTANGPVVIGGGLTNSVNISGALTLNNGSRVVMNPTVAGNGQTHSIGSLSIGAASSMDIGNHTVIVQNAPDETVIGGYLSNGYAAGFWNGTSATGGAITSVVAFNDNSGATSVGYGNSSDFTFSGSTSPYRVGGPKALSGNQVVVAPALAGDLLLEGSVGPDDLAFVLNAFGTTGNNWAFGNIDYDAAGLVGPNDLSLLLANFGHSSSGFAGAKTSAKSLTSTAKPSLVASSSDVAPPPADGIELIVNTTNGDVELEGNLATLATSVVLTSPGNTLIGGTTFTPAFHALFDTTASNTSGLIDEFNTFANGSTVDGIIDMGNVYNAAQNSEDVQFQFSEKGINRGGLQTGSVFYVTGVPEPTTMSLLAVASVGLLGRRRKRRN